MAELMMSDLEPRLSFVLIVSLHHQLDREKEIKASVFLLLMEQSHGNLSLLLMRLGYKMFFSDYITLSTNNQRRHMEKLVE